MAADEQSTGTSPETASEARRLAERGLHEQAVGNIAEADRLLAQAQELDLDAVADVLREHDAGRARCSAARSCGSGCREGSAADHARACADVEATVPGPSGLVARALQGAHQARLVHRELFERLALEARHDGCDEPTRRAHVKDHSHAGNSLTQLEHRISKISSETGAYASAHGC